MSDQMFFYNVGYGTCEESEYWQFTHKGLYTEAELEQIVQDCMLEVLVKAAKPKAKWSHQRSPKIQDVMGDSHGIRKNGELLRIENRFLMAMERRGFKQVKFDRTISLFGWASCLDPKDWRSYTCPEQRKFVKTLRSRFLKARPNYLKDLKVGEASEKKHDAILLKRSAKRDKTPGGIGTKP